MSSSHKSSQCGSFGLNNFFQAEIEKYKAERERAFADYEAKFAGAKDDIATR